MRGAWVNDSMRKLIGFALTLGGAGLHLIFLLRVLGFSWNQRRLKRKFEIDLSTPILSFGPEVQGAILRLAHDQSASLAQTSGSTSTPKYLMYTRKRLRWTALQFVDVFARSYLFLKPRRKSLFIFSSAGKDDSLTSFLVNESPHPGRVAALQAPYRLLACPEVQMLVSDYGLHAARLFILVLTNPGVLYSTNPSTLFMFFEELEKKWIDHSRLIREYSTSREKFAPQLHELVQQNASRGSVERFHAVCSSAAYPGLEVLVPGLDLYCCWTGGYVAPFLSSLEKFLPSPRYRLLPMYSMSTETIETVTDCSGERPTFLPLALGVFYEFIEEGSEDHVKNIVLATHLQTGKNYCLIVSDSYGLKRYQTGDLFLCKGFHRSVPDLHFVRRRNLEYSFTGEKITAEQMTSVYSKLRLDLKLPSETYLTCLPSHLPSQTPHYTLVVVGGTRLHQDEIKQMAERAEMSLRDINFEYRAKILSCRLSPMRAEQVSMEEFVKRVAGPSVRECPAQFKMLPLYQKLWGPNEPH